MLTEATLIKDEATVWNEIDPGSDDLLKDFNEAVLSKMKKFPLPLRKKVKKDKLNPKTFETTTTAGNTNQAISNTGFYNDSTDSRIGYHEYYLGIQKG